MNRNVIQTLILFCIFSHFCAYCSSIKSIAHRGANSFAPENTLAAFIASSNKSDLVEFDVRVSSDDELIVIHDDSVDRTTDGTGKVNALTLAQLKTLDAGSWFSSAFTNEPLPTLSEALECILTFATPLIEHKAGTAQAYVDALHTMNVSSNVIVQSFDWSFLSDVHALDPTIKLAALGNGELTAEKITDILATGATTIAWGYGYIRIEQVELIHTSGLDVYIWTVNGPIIQSKLELGVDGIISNDPALVCYLRDDTPSSNPDLATDLLSYWKFDDGLTNANCSSVTDIEGRNHGTIYDQDIETLWISGNNTQFGSALNLDGTNCYVDIPQSASLDINTNTLTISCWLKMEKLPSSISEDFAGIYDSEQDSYVIFQDRSSKQLCFKLTTSDGDYACPGIAESALVADKWHHVVCIFDGNVGPASGETSIYLDGQLMDVRIGADNKAVDGLTHIVKAGQNAAIGRNGADNRYGFEGAVDDIAIWRRVLTYGEILQIYYSGEDNPPLQKSILAINISEVNMDSTQMHLRAQLTHGTLNTSELVLKGSVNASGPFENEINYTTVNAGNNEYIFNISREGNPSRFFKLVNP
ncbi:MAG: glycerophosphodiester phosphodiesterase family protein [Kiritimatiellae bacterium]|jgi:glycerophosphoryl diester phosphodiesterase|nr:glycerophosphodiester phosphodiesterase family protein [Kiritimatiellia bacterium]